MLRYAKNMLRRVPRRVTLVITVLFVFFISFKLLNNPIDDNEEWYKHPDAYFSEVECYHDAFTMNLYNELTSVMNSALKKLGLTYFLCYGSLWGALRMKKTLPWDRNLDFCILKHELVAIDTKRFDETLKSFGLDYYYNSRRGKYIVYFNGVSAEITVFERVGSRVERTGWEKRLFPHLYLNFQNFPYSLVEKQPLKTIEFNSLQIPAPYEVYEIQKYLYPDNWWRIVKPKGCPD
jgi:hypothetical protein